MDDKKFSKTKICLQCVFVFLQIMPCVVFVKNELLDMNVYGFRLYKKSKSRQPFCCRDLLFL